MPRFKQRAHIYQTCGGRITSIEAESRPQGSGQQKTDTEGADDTYSLGRKKGPQRTARPEKQVRWLMYLSGFDFQVEHQPGKRNPADLLSRRPNYIEDRRRTSPLEFIDIQLKLTAAYYYHIHTDKAQLKQDTDYIRKLNNAEAKRTR